jgi:hypothetical protein
MIFLHGNLSDACEARGAGAALRRLLHCAAGDRPYRMALWSWPSQRVTRPLRRDAQVKARYSDTQGYYLAGLLRDLDPRVPITLVGYSFGARAVCDALHMLSGGEVVGLRPADSEHPEPPRRIRAVLIAAAMDAHWLGTRGRLAGAVPMTERTTILVNHLDPALKRYPKLYGRRCRGPQALGYVGPRGLSAESAALVRLRSVGCSVGRHHGWDHYLRSCALRSAVVAATFSAAESEGPGQSDVAAQ